MSVPETADCLLAKLCKQLLSPLESTGLFFAYCLYLSLMPQFVCAVAWNLAGWTGALYWVSERVYTVALRLSSLQVGKQGSDKFKQHKAVCFSDAGRAAR